MFGYVMINKQELKFKDFDFYHACYCGLCKTLKERYGLSGQLSLNYDMTFVILLLGGLYEPESERLETRCIAHPLEKHPCLVNEYTQYAADMNVLLTYYKCQDDWEDERKKSRLLYAKLLEKDCKRVSKQYPQKANVITEKLRELSIQEQKGTMDIDYMAGLFGEIMAAILVYREDEWKPLLQKMGMYLGKFIYLADAYEDIREDVKNHSYNPLNFAYQQDDFEQECKTILTMLIAECSKAFEELPIIENADILRNILYSGIWYRYEKVREERRKEKEKEHD
ncbi:MAG: DUF5685 family protein [Lachnospiraceae bacterium]